MQAEHLSDYDFDLPEHLIAQHPLPERSASRLLVLCEHMNAPLHRGFVDVLDYLNPGDSLVVNNTKVFAGRLFGQKIPSGGKVEILLSRAHPNGNWICLAQTRSGIRTNLKVQLPTGIAHFVRKVEDEPGAWEVAFDCDIFACADQHGAIPLPRYISRLPDPEDLIRYQTVFSDPNQKGAVAAPTAGLHFDQNLLEIIRQKGVNIVEVTLHVGPGTFLPIRTDNLDEHRMHVEPWSLSENAAQTLNNTRATGGRIIAVGTTSIRTLETSLREQNGQVSEHFRAGQGLTRIFIRPGFQFAAIDGMITNFHQPKTTLLLLVAAAIGRNRLLETYRRAIDEQYRFFSYGDACYFDILSANKMRV